MKKRIILISISFVLVILSIFLLFTKLNNKVNVEDFNNETTIKEENPTTNSKDPITFKDIDNKKEEKKDTNTYNNTNTNKSNNTSNTTNTNKTNNTNTNKNDNINNNSTNNNPTPVTPPKPITYSCPDGFELQGTDCYQTFAATHICANGMTSIDSGCINFSEGIETPEETCQNGYYGLSMISLGQPSKYYCYPIHEISFTCPEGYNLNGMNCTKIIPANRN